MFMSIPTVDKWEYVRRWKFSIKQTWSTTISFFWKMWSGGASIYIDLRGLLLYHVCFVAWQLTV